MMEDISVKQVFDKNKINKTINLDRKLLYIIRKGKLVVLIPYNHILFLPFWNFTLGIGAPTATQAMLSKSEPYSTS